MYEINKSNLQVVGCCRGVGMKFTHFTWSNQASKDNYVELVYCLMCAG